MTDTQAPIAPIDSTSPSPSASVYADQNPHEYLIDSLLPAREVHLIGGPSGAGKTTWLIQLLQTWASGKSVFGHQSHPCPFLYVSIDRSRAGVLRTLKRMHIDPDSFPFYVPRASEQQSSMIPMLESIVKSHPSTRLLAIEGFQSKCPGNLIDNKVVQQYLIDLRLFCEQHNITIIGVVHSAKAKEGEGYLNPRERIAGSFAWAAYSDTIVVIEPNRANDPDDSTRAIFLSPRNGPSHQFKYDFRDGLLVELASPKPAIDNRRKFGLWWIARAATTSSTDIYGYTQILTETAIPEGSFARALSDAISDGLISKHDKLRGKYRLTPFTNVAANVREMYGAPADITPN